MTDFTPLHCRCCHRQLALATPYRLLFNVGVCCEEPVALRCMTCGARRFWKPLDSIVYTDDSASVLIRADGNRGV